MREAGCAGNEHDSFAPAAAGVLVDVSAPGAKSEGGVSARSRVVLALAIALGATGLSQPSPPARLDELKGLVAAKRYAEAEAGARALLAETHSSENIGTTDVHALVIEMKEHSSAAKK